MITVLGVVEVRRPDGGIAVRIEVCAEFFAQAQRGLCAHAAREGLDNAPGGPRRGRATPATLVEIAPTMEELNADAWRRARRGEDK